MQKRRKVGNLNQSVSTYAEQSTQDGECSKERIEQLVDRLKSCELGLPRHSEQVMVLQELAQIAAKDQEIAASTNNSDGVFDSSEHVVQAIVANSKIGLILELLGDTLRKLPTMPAESNSRVLLCSAIKSLLILVKCCSDTRDVFEIFNYQSFFAVLSYVSIVTELAKLDSSIGDFASLCATLYIYCIYNAARHADHMQMGVSDKLLKLIDSHRCVTTALSLYIDSNVNLSNDCIITLAEFLAVLAESEIFLDHAETCFDRDTSALFLQFYDKEIKGAMQNQEERQKLLSLEEIVSFIKRERPDVWSARTAKDNQ
ncbi:Hypothetical protein GLP15_3271 [Giardia lamblia P15]|uniref:Uncharacterized protein n=1 Tax=Giardia intestinalis (strain P15) TaxID=658858 RepID=E1F2A3_GIAIA|nr:Hypothetical protein GLP15_3271 [Giardia lamblia P15]